VLKRLREDFLTLAPNSDPQVRISFGALRHHVLHQHFIEDVRDLLAEGALPAERLELRIAEQALLSRDPADFESLRRQGVRLVVDEMARGISSIDGLARAPIWGLQLDRAWTIAARSDAVAFKVCRACIGMATALGLTPLAAGVDDEQQRQTLLALGCHYGTGDLYHESPADIMRPSGSLAGW
jgi:EAL domain-containing protein (putative c-di-GMP-specific phosphodiesterase class I)